MDPLTLTLIIVAVLVVGIVLYVLKLRAWHMSWGTIGDETTRPLPGDELIKNPKANATHGETINASAAEVWPWLAQIGQGRGGFYSYDWLENLFGCQITNVDRVMEEYQDVKLGDGIKLHPQAPPLDVVHLEPGKALVIAGGTALQPNMPKDTSFLGLHRYKAFTWAFILDEVAPNKTRFLARVRGDWDGGGPVGFFRNRVFMEPAHSIMQRKMNIGLKERVEAAVKAKKAGTSTSEAAPA